MSVRDTYELNLICNREGTRMMNAGTGRCVCVCMCVCVRVGAFVRRVARYTSSVAVMIFESNRM